MQLQVLQRMTPKRKVFADEEAARRSIREQKPGNRSASLRLLAAQISFSYSQYLGIYLAPIHGISSTLMPQ